MNVKFKSFKKHFIFFSNVIVESYLNTKYDFKYHSVTTWFMNEVRDVFINFQCAKAGRLLEPDTDKRFDIAHTQSAHKWKNHVTGNLCMNSEYPWT